MSVARRSYVDRMSSTDCHTYDARAARAVPPGGPGRTPDSASAQVSSRTRTSQPRVRLETCALARIGQEDLVPGTPCVSPNSCASPCRPVRSGSMAPRAGIGGEKKRGISTILFRRFSSIRVFVADLDNSRRRGRPRGPRIPLTDSRAAAAGAAPRPLTTRALP